MTGRRVGPWLTPAVLVADVVLVWSGMFDWGTAVVLVVGLEALLWLILAGRTVAAVRRYRDARDTGMDGWAVAEDALAEVVPRRLARFVLLEPRLWACLARWATGRHDGHRPGAYAYHDCVRITIWVAIGLTVLEGGLAELILALALPGSVWVWVAAGVHAYALALLAGFYASLITRPHLIEADVLRLRESVLTEVTVPSSAIRSARAASSPGRGRTWWRVDTDTETGTTTGTLAYGDANVILDLDPDQPILVNARPCPTRLDTLVLTADDPRGFTAALNRSECAATARHTSSKP